jgi:hypothetical protein
MLNEAHDLGSGDMRGGDAEILRFAQDDTRAAPLCFWVPEHNGAGCGGYCSCPTGRA